MGFIFSVVLIFCTITSALTAAYAGHYGDPAHPGKCVLRGLILSPGEVHYDSKKCEKTSCEENSWASFYSCGVFKPPDGCKLGEPMEPNALYPACCSRNLLCNNI